MSISGVTVVGSYNVGLFLKGRRFPIVGETVIGDKFHEGGGGKGSNQAIAASLLGAKSTFIGRIGNDKYGEDALALYKSVGMQTKFVCVDSTTHSGISVILIDDKGQNLIMIVPGANFNLSPEDIDRAESAVKNSFIVGFQLENRLEVTDYAIRKSHSMGVKTLLDPAPAVALPEDLYPFVDYIKPNETEATILTGIEVKDQDSASQAGKWLIDKGVKTALITLGRQGTVLVTDNDVKSFDAPQVKALDSTGAGDIFSGGLMAALSGGKNIEDAVVFANHAAALSVTKLGVIESIPTLEETKAFIADRS